MINTLHLNGARSTANALQLYIAFQIKPICEIHIDIQVTTVKVQQMSD